MKREIKFRAWNEGKMVDLLAITPLALDANMNTQLALKGMSGLFLPFGGGIDLMQFTGLKDKNGKEIYEGDIVHVEYFKMAVGENLGVYETEAELTGVVEFDGLSLILQNIVGEKWQEYTGHDAGGGKCKFMYLGDVYEGSLDASYQMEIIGNIYENAELLNK
jgi:uncharacterized phage protein (TIGR01671 family)